MENIRNTQQTYLILLNMTVELSYVIVHLGTQVIDHEVYLSLVSMFFVKKFCHSLNFVSIIRLFSFKEIIQLKQTSYLKP